MMIRTPLKNDQELENSEYIDVFSLLMLNKDHESNEEYQHRLKRVEK